MVKISAGQVIRLKNTWHVVGAQFDSGGFGAVFEVESGGESGFVAKFVPAEPGASRELLFSDLPASKYVVPVVDKGPWEDYLVLVMPRATKSLQQELNDRRGLLPVPEALRVLLDVASGLAEISGQVVHRDLKPGNVLLLDDRWQIADFGLARYADAATASDTRKHAMTPPYAAPEQWRGHRAIAATDVYALGVMAFQMLSGSLPFPGPDFRHQHLFQEPPRLENAPASLEALVAECLIKEPGARPTAGTVVNRLHRQALAPARFPALEAANREAVLREAREALELQALEEARNREAGLRSVAMKSLAAISDVFITTIVDSAPRAKVSRDQRGPSFHVALSDADLRLGAISEARPAQGIPFDVLHEARIRLQIPAKYDWEGREHSLWYCDAQEVGVYRWFEVAFAMNGMTGRRARTSPFGSTPSEDVAIVLGGVMHTLVIAWPFTPIDQGDEIDFVDRWLGWFADATVGNLSMPTRTPERQVQGSWRR